MKEEDMYLCQKYIRASKNALTCRSKYIGTFELEVEGHLIKLIQFKNIEYNGLSNKLYIYRGNGEVEDKDIPDEIKATMIVPILKFFKALYIEIGIEENQMRVIDRRLRSVGQFKDLTNPAF